MEGLIISMGCSLAVAVAVAFLIWISTNRGKKWLKDM